jgi:hypothetical protein
MKGRRIKEIGGSSRGMYIRNIADITSNWNSIRNADIMPNWGDICSTVDIPKLGAMQQFLHRWGEIPCVILDFQQM